MSDPTTMDGIADKAVEAPGRGAGASILGGIAANAGSLGASGLAGAGNIGYRPRSGHFLTAENGGAGAISATRDEVGAWERFELETAVAGCISAGDRASMRTSDDFYLRADPEGGLDAMSTTAGPWETFTFHRRGDGAIQRGDFMALEANSGLYITAVPHF